MKDSIFEEETQKWVDMQTKKYKDWQRRNELIKPIKHYKVIEFSNDMQRELDNNSHKGDWEDFTCKESVLKEFEYHFKKVLTVLEGGESIIQFEELLREHISDCANILMFLGNSYNLYDKKS